jgi:hypothetical protein
LIVISTNSFAQGGGTHAIEFTYDPAGNLLTREIIFIPYRNMQTNNDSTANNTVDTAGIAANVNNAANNQ